MAVPERHLVVVPVTGAAERLVAADRARCAAPTTTPPHVVVVDADEVTDPVLLRARLVAAAERLPPFPLVLGAVNRDVSPRRGVARDVEDPAGVWRWLRDFALAPPMAVREVVPHVPIVGPGAGRAARRAWKRLGSDDPRLEFRVAEIHLVVERDGVREVLDRLPLDAVAVSPGTGPLCRLPGNEPCERGSAPWRPTPKRPTNG